MRAQYETPVANDDERRLGQNPHPARNSKGSTTNKTRDGSTSQKTSPANDAIFVSGAASKCIHTNERTEITGSEARNAGACLMKKYSQGDRWAMGWNMCTWSMPT